jgi:predicted nucleic acid-binding protein
VSAGVLDTSVFIASESGRPLRRELLPDEGYVTVVTMAELEAGVLAAQSVDARATRLRTVQALSNLELLDIDAAAAHEWATLRYKLVVAGRRVNVNDLWIAAVAHARHLPVITQDDDFDAISAVGGPMVTRV